MKKSATKTNKHHHKNVKSLSRVNQFTDILSKLRTNLENQNLLSSNNTTKNQRQLQIHDTINEDEVMMDQDMFSKQQKNLINQIKLAYKEKGRPP